MNKIMNQLKLKAVFMLMFAMSLITTMGLSTMAIAADETFDLVAPITSSIGDIRTQMFAIIAVIVPVVLAIVGAKLGITKGISIFKSLTGK